MLLLYLIFLKQIKLLFFFNKQTLIYGVHLVWILHHLQMNYVLWILLAFFQILIHEFYKEQKILYIFLIFQTCNLLSHHFFKNRSYFEQIKLTPSPTRHPQIQVLFDLELPDGLVKWSTEQLTVVFGEVNRSNPFVVGFIKLPQTLSCQNFPNLKEGNML